MDALDYYLLDQHLEYYFADAEDEQEGLEDDDYDDSQGPFFVNFN